LPKATVAIDSHAQDLVAVVVRIRSQGRQTDDVFVHAYQGHAAYKKARESRQGLVLYIVLDDVGFSAMGSRGAG
jgi:hypothetical protein